MNSHDVHVSLGDRSYDIHIGTGTLEQLPDVLIKLSGLSHGLLITDSNLAAHAQRVRGLLTQRGIRVDTIEVPAGESSKSTARLHAIWEQMLACGTDRHSVVLAVGGGVVGDLGGFAAASFTRGLRFVQIPTSLLAQVDSSVGGKVGINLPGAKNMVGAFWQPLHVAIDTQLLASLPEREYRSGLGEVVKYGVIMDEPFFGFLEQHVEEISQRDDEIVAQTVSRCCRLKAQVVEADEREMSGQRAWLNYGHTFCHAIEAVTGYGTFLHGEAVSIGMLCASRLAESLGRIGADVTRRQRDLLAALQLPFNVPDVPVTSLLDAMKHDKKVSHGKLQFVLPYKMGGVELVSDVDEQLVLQAMQPA